MKKNIFLTMLMLIISIVCVGASAYLFGKSFRDIFLMLIIIIACLGAVIFSMAQSNLYGSLHYDNGKHMGRFTFTYIFGIAAGCVFPLFDETGWALPSLALALSMFSNTVTGLIAYAGILCICVHIASADTMVFLIYFIVGIVFAILFEGLDDEYKTGKPMFMATLIYIAVMVAQVMFQNDDILSEELYVMPAINIFITFIIMLVVLKFYCAVVIDKETGKYITINDQEYELLAKYKDIDSQMYYNAIHTAYFAEKTARILHMDVDVAKNGGYYHRIIANECKVQDKSIEEICSDNKFPPKAVRLLQEYNYKSQNMKMKETVAVYLADCVVSSIMYLIGKDDEQEIEYDKLATAVIHRKVESGILDNSDISLADLGGIEKIYTGEKLYYDFLRRE
jgi:hypothetical protein